MSEAEVEEHNRRELWRDVANHLTIARESIEQAQSALDDLGETDTVVFFQEHADGLARAAAAASERAKRWTR